MSSPPARSLAPPATGLGRWPLAAAAVVTALFALSNAPTPLYLHWQAELGFGAHTLTTIFALYIAGLLLTLPVAGRLADRHGRAAVLVPGVAVAIVASLLFLTATSVLALALARLLTGIAVGVAVAAGMAAVVDLGGPSLRAQASLAASIAMVFGAGLGPLLAGAVAELSDAPVVPVFAIATALLTAAFALALLLPLTRPPRPAAAAPAGGTRLVPSSEHARLLSPPRVPRANRRQLALGVAAFAPGISATSFVLALGPSLLARLLGGTSPLLAGGTACAMFLSATASQLAARALPLRALLLAGCATTALAMAALTAAACAAIVPLLVVAALLAGTGQGLGQLGGLTLIATHVPADRRAEANAALSSGGYLPAGTLAVATGFLVDALGLVTATVLFAGALAAAAAVAAAVIAREPVEPSPT